MRWTLNATGLFLFGILPLLCVFTTHVSAASVSRSGSRACLENDPAPTTQQAERITVGDKLRIVISDLDGPGIAGTATPSWMRKAGLRFRTCRDRC